MRGLRWLLLSGMAFAQVPPATVGPTANAGPTAIGVGQIKAPPGMANLTCVMVFVNGFGTCATMGPTVTVTTVNGAPVISAVSAGTPVVGETYTAASAQTAFPLAHTPLAGTFCAFRNGLRQVTGGDYTISGGTVTFATVVVGDTFVFDYSY